MVPRDITQDLQNTSMRAYLTRRPTFHLSVVEIRGHGSGGVEEPCVNKVGNIGGVLRRASDHPGHGII